MSMSAALTTIGLERHYPAAVSIPNFPAGTSRLLVRIYTLRVSIEHERLR